MRFTSDTDLALDFAARFANTNRRGVEQLQTPGDLLHYLDAVTFTGRKDGSVSELQAVRRWRTQLRAIWLLDERELVVAVNGVLASRNATPQLLQHDGYDWHFHATPLDAPLPDRLAVEAAMALADVIRAGEIDRLGACQAQDCDNLLFDFTKNRSRRYCATGGCANRANVAAFRARRGRAPGERTRKA